MDTIITERRETTLVITLNRPEAMNAVNVVMCEEVTRCLVEASSDPRTRVVIVTGAGERAFSAGADIKEEKEHTALGMYAFAGTGQRMCETMERCQRPVIAAIRGYALGGGMELALACDFRVAAEDAVLGFPELGLAVMPGWGGTQRLPRLIGLAKAKEMILTGRRYTGAQALAFGLVNEACPRGKVLERALALAGELALNGPTATGFTKQALNFSLDMSLPAGADLEMSANALCAATEDRAEGLASFVEKRKPVYKGR